MTERLDLETALADMRAESDTLARAHAAPAPERLREWADLVERAAEDWLTFISEGNAAIRAGRTEETIRAKYAALEREGHARTRNGRREYRACMIPRRANIDVAAERGREAARAVRDERGKRAS